MADAAHHRHRRRTDRAHDALVVEGPEVLEGPAAATDDQDVDFAASAGERSEFGSSIAIDGDLAFVGLFLSFPFLFVAKRIMR